MAELSGLNQIVACSLARLLLGFGAQSVLAVRLVLLSNILHNSILWTHELPVADKL